ncbi:M14 family metallopeptidase [Cellulophaga baltica]|uniref:M14 family metallopeptidase n=1 Tax=Cellulophaga TaxID=104264 RepID=UPI001C075C94|nr:MULTISPECIES: M14 family metallopeptidase [Cellulophaga]MBU2994972.1 M14 family metallopeptidase [Cellulophaga baltica]MDO6766367.1 M14 family metallopeptidase [Cellulophaga sp. 1_MG-2023]
MKFLYAILFTFLLFGCESQTESETSILKTHFENSNGTETATYQETIDFYIKLAKEYPEINIQTIGDTDSGFPLHLVTYNLDGDFNFKKIQDSKTTILINNGIHPGESDGIDATMLLFRDLATEKNNSPENTVIATIPIYNIGGSLNRNSTTRANQNGPKEYGFRGNANNYDLNRDFIKSDTKNSKTFASIFHLVKPDIFIDNHVSNGADYQYTLTHLFTQHNKLGFELGNYLNTELMPKLEEDLAKDNWDITPYVNVFNRVPESGFSQFMDSPRYSSGYTTLWNTLGMMVETHMLKPYKTRVEGTYELMVKMISITENEGLKIKELREKSLEELMVLEDYHIQWKIDTTQTTTLNFKGFEADTLISEVTGLPRLKYDKSRPFTKPVTYQNYFKPKKTIKIPDAYIIKKSNYKVINLLRKNFIEFTSLKKDTLIEVESYKIKDYDTKKGSYEGHYLHQNTTVTSTVKNVQFKQGDIYIPTRQSGIRYILETLEPEAVDSFFNWNFFDTILQQKEGFSPYVFEDVAIEVLKENSLLSDAFQYKKLTDEKFANDYYAQLEYIFQHSEYYEPAHLQYPVYRVLKDFKLEVD